MLQIWYMRNENRTLDNVTNMIYEERKRDTEKHNHIHESWLKLSVENVRICLKSPCLVISCIENEKKRKTTVENARFSHFNLKVRVQCFETFQYNLNWWPKYLLKRSIIISDKVMVFLRESLKFKIINGNRILIITNTDTSRLMEIMPVLIDIANVYSKFYEIGSVLIDLTNVTLHFMESL